MKDDVKMNSAIKKGIDKNEEQWIKDRNCEYFGTIDDSNRLLL